MTDAIRVTPQSRARAFAGLPRAARLALSIPAQVRCGRLEVQLPDRRLIFEGAEAGPSALMIVRDLNFAWRLLRGGDIGVAEAYLRGEWETPDLTAFLYLFCVNVEMMQAILHDKPVVRAWQVFRHWLNRNTRRQAERNIHAHYDLGNDFYSTWLDPTMSYSSGYRFDPAKGEAALENAQRRKWERLGDRLGSPGSVLEIGCGWGSLANFFALRSARVTAISLSDQQLGWARFNQSDAIDFRHQDYRDVTGQFDAVVSVEMVEAVGREYWPDFFDCIARCLKPGGRAAIQWIAMRDDIFEAYARNADFIQAYVFPGGLLIRESEFRQLAAERGLSWQDQEDFALDYAETLKAWRARFDAAVEAGRLPAGFDERFVRLWRFYLMYCEGGFRGGGITVSQVTLVKRPA
jgi:cyclopropane-fatty-acyl-phospholipid synthase